MKSRILLVNPPIYDFAAYDFWLKPYGLLEVAGFLRHQAEFTLFDCMDRWHPSVDTRHNAWLQGQFPWTRLPKPECLEAVPRYYRRYGLERNLFTDLLYLLAGLMVPLVQFHLTICHQFLQNLYGLLFIHALDLLFEALESLLVLLQQFLVQSTGLETEAHAQDSQHQETSHIQVFMIVYSQDAIRVANKRLYID